MTPGLHSASCHLFLYLPSSFAAFLLLLRRLLARGAGRGGFLLPRRHHVAAGGGSGSGHRSGSGGGRGARGRLTGIPGKDGEAESAAEGSNSVDPCSQRARTDQTTLLPSLPACPFLSGPSSCPSSCLCSRNAPSWVATSRGQGSLWGRSFWAVFLKRRSGGIGVKQQIRYSQQS